MRLDQRQESDLPELEGEVRLVGADTIIIEREVSCPVEQAWRAVTDPRDLSAWFVDTTIDLQEGGRFSFRDAWDGRLGRIVPPKLVEYLNDHGGVSYFEIHGVDGAVAVKLTDRLPVGLAPAGVWSERSARQPGGPGTHWVGVVAGWHGFLDSLSRHLGGSPPATTLDQLEYYYERLLTEYFR